MQICTNTFHLPPSTFHLKKGAFAPFLSCFLNGHVGLGGVHPHGGHDLGEGEALGLKGALVHDGLGPGLDFGVGDALLVIRDGDFMILPVWYPCNTNIILKPPF